MSDHDAMMRLHRALDGWNRHRGGDGQAGAELRASLSEAYWQAAREVVRRALTKDSAGGLNFDDAGVRLLDFGQLDHPAISPIPPVHDSTDREEVLLVHEMLGKVHDAVRRSDLIAGLERDVEILQRDIDLWPETHLSHLRYRDERVRRLLHPDPRVTNVLESLAEVDDRLEQYQRLKVLDHDGIPDAEDRRAWREIRDYVESRRHRIVSALQSASGRSPGLAAEVTAASESVDESVAHLISLQARRRQLEQKLIENRAAAQRVTPREVEAALMTELDALAGLMRLAASYARLGECAIPLEQGVEWIDLNAARDACRHVVSFDPRIFDNPMARRFGSPVVLLTPGIGDGVFDATRNRWVIPQRSLSGSVESVAHAAIHYRLEVHDGPELLSSYRKGVPARRGTRANLKLRSGLVRDYIAWMTEETFGREALSRGTRDWFERHIAPDKEQPWIPPEYRGLREGALKRVLKDQGDDAEDRYRAGVLSWMLAPDDPRALKEAALPELRKALDGLPDSEAVLYSTGVVAMKAGDFQLAIDCFRRFSDVARPGWWTAKAAELCARCR